MKNEELLYQMALTMLPDIGAITAKKLIAHIGSSKAVFKEKTANLQLIPGIGRHLAAMIRSDSILQKAEQEFRVMEKEGISSLYFQDPDYPWKLKNCDDSPLLLFYRGKKDFNRSKYLSVVGTREATSYGKEACRSIIAYLAGRFPDLVIVSGLAYGIDITAHRAALDFGMDTIAVLAHGLNTVYPSVHRDAARRITMQGALVSDFHSTIKPERNNFLRRNRIIAGLSDATFVVESGAKGGSLITAEMASSYSREVLALPGRNNDRYSTGCNTLIKRNVAALVESGEDIAYLLNWDTDQPTKEAQVRLSFDISADEQRILETIRDHQPAGSEIISIKTGMPLHTVISKLLQMELQSWVRVQPGNTYKLCIKLP